MTTRNLNPITQFPEPEVYKHEWLDRFAAGMALQNPISRAFDHSYVPIDHTLYLDYDEKNETYNPFDDPQTKGYDPNVFAYSKSEQQTKNVIDRIEANRNLVRRAQGGTGFAGEIAGVFTNPFILGPAVITSGMRVSAIIAGEVGGELVNEVILHSQQPERTKLETALNIGAAGVLTGIFIKAGRAMGIAEVPGATIDETFTKTRVAQAVDDIMAQDYEKAAGEMVSLGPLGRAIAYISPSGDILANSPSKIAKEVVQNLVETGYKFEPGKVVPQAVETAVRAADGDIATMAHYFDDVFVEYRKGGGHLKKNQFLEAVADAMRNGDVHKVAAVQKVARLFRQYDQKYFDQAFEVGLYGKDKPILRGAKSHLQRIYDRGKLMDGYEVLRKMLRNKISNSIARSQNYVMVRYYDPQVEDTVTAYVHANQLGHYDAMYRDVVVVTGNELKQLSPEMIVKAADDAAVSTINRLLSSNPIDVATLDYIVPKAGSLHNRTMTLLSDNQLRPFLNNNALDVMHVTSHQMTREIEMTKVFGDTRMSKYFGETGLIRKEYDTLMGKAKTAKERNYLLDRMNKDINHIQAMRDLILGTYGAPKDATARMVRFGRGARVLAMLSYGANITSSSFSDMMSPVLRNGFEPLKDGLKVLFSGIKPEYVKYVQRLGIGTEAITNARAIAFAEMAFIGKFNQQALRIYGKYTGLNWFTDMSMTLNAVSTSEMWTRWLRQFDNLSTKKKQKLLDMGIDDEWAGRIIDQIRTHGKTKNGVTLPESHLWDDAAAARRYENALRKAVNVTTIIPGKGDIPLWMKTETGKFFGMFMSWMMASSQRWLLAGMQRADLEFLQGYLAIAVAGGMVQWSKDMVKGIDMSDRDPVEYIISGMDRGGNFGFFAMPVEWARQMSDTTSGKRAAGLMLDDLLIPAGARYAGDILGLVGKMASGQEMTEDDIWKAVRSIPLLNSWHAMDLLQRATE